MKQMTHAPRTAPDSRLPELDRFGASAHAPPRRKFQIDPSRLAEGAIVLTALTLLVWFYALHISQPLDTLISTVADDEFYVLQTARNLVAGRGLTFDGISPTTGFHPLYLALVALIHSAGIDSIPGLVRATIVLKAGFLIASAGLLYGLLWRSTSSTGVVRLALLAYAAAFGLHPYLLFLGVSGLEQNLSIFCLLLFLLWLYHDLRDPRPISALWGGLAFALAYLARTDNIVLLPVALLAAVLGPAGGPKRRLVRAGCLMLGAAILILPWFAAALAFTGTFEQYSGATKAFVGGRWALSFPERLGAVIGFYQGTWWPMLWRGTQWVVVFLPLLLLGSAVSPPLPRTAPAADRARFVLLAVLLAYGLGLGLVYGWIFAWTREWYWGTSVTALVAALGVGLGHTLSGVQRPWRQVFALAAVGLAFGAGWVHWQGRIGYVPPWNSQPELLAAGRWLGHVRLDGRCAAWNAGILGSFSGVPVTNLDGLINNDILPALRTGTLHRYFAKANIRYVLDYAAMPASVKKGLPRGWVGDHLRPVRRFAGSWSGSPIVLWAVDREDERARGSAQLVGRTENRAVVHLQLQTIENAALTDVWITRQPYDAGWPMNVWRLEQGFWRPRVRLDGMEFDFRAGPPGIPPQARLVVDFEDPENVVDADQNVRIHLRLADGRWLNERIRGPAEGGISADAEDPAAGDPAAQR